MGEFSGENLLVETLKDIEESGHKIGDIIFIGSEETGHRCTWKEYEKLADKRYDPGFGGQEVASDLIIVFNDGTKMWRHEYDGSEYWEFSKPFDEPKERKRINRLFVAGKEVGWRTLSDMHEDEKKDRLDAVS